MLPLVDWISQSYRLSVEPPNDEDPRDILFGELFYHLDHPDLFDFLYGLEWAPVTAKFPFSHAFLSKPYAFAIKSHVAGKSAILEAPGAACKELEDRDYTYALLRAGVDSMTRLDLSADIETDVRPADFVWRRDNKRSRAGQHHWSDAGETIYVGSMKSEKLARVYRYAAPHPRWPFLRIEHQLKRDYACEGARLALVHGIPTAVQMTGNNFGWSHPIWTEATITDQAAEFWRPETRMGDTERWLLTQVGPAFRRYCAESGVEDPEEWLRANILTALTTDGQSAAGD